MKAEKIWFDNSRIYLKIDTGEEGSLPLKAFPRLYHATTEQRDKFELSPMGIHWPDLDEDLSFAGFFENRQKADNDLARLFENFPEINISQLARVARINRSLFAQYLAGIETPSPGRKNQIIEQLHRLGKELLAAKL